jgi:hypothetical protein
LNIVVTLNVRNYRQLQITVISYNYWLCLYNKLICYAK